MARRLSLFQPQMKKLLTLFSIICASLLLSSFDISKASYFDAHVAGEESVEVNIYPNPVTDGYLNIRSEHGISEVVVLNILGQPIYRESFDNSRQVELYLDTQEKGIFLVQVLHQNTNQVIIKRVLFK